MKEEQIMNNVSALITITSVGCGVLKELIDDGDLPDNMEGQSVGTDLLGAILLDAMSLTEVDENESN